MLVNIFAPVLHLFALLLLFLDFLPRSVDRILHYPSNVCDGKVPVGLIQVELCVRVHHCWISCYWWLVCRRLEIIARLFLHFHALANISSISTHIQSADKTYIINRITFWAYAFNSFFLVHSIWMLGFLVYLVEIFSLVFHSLLLFDQIVFWVTLLILFHVFNVYLVVLERFTAAAERRLL